jgi:hypothetical protein
VTDLLERWHHIVTEAAADFQRLDDAKAGRRPARDKWSAKEIIGHLIDSAANNHRRFVEAQLKEVLIFPGYAQDQWVARQHYADVPWRALLSLWTGYNEQLIRVVRAIPGPTMHRPRFAHNLDEIGWRPLPRSQPATLAYLIEDYVGHLEHHLRQARYTLEQ